MALLISVIQSIICKRKKNSNIKLEFSECLAGSLVAREGRKEGGRLGMRILLEFAIVCCRVNIAASQWRLYSKRQAEDDFRMFMHS